MSTDARIKFWSMSRLVDVQGRHISISVFKMTFIHEVGFILKNSTSKADVME